MVIKRHLCGLFIRATLAAGSTVLFMNTPVHAQSTPASCQFVLGFKVLHDLDPGDVGDCQDNQASAANGDAQQHTGLGLLAWRKADNWTAFTNGYWTWINGPAGLAKRLNTQRFSWEANPDNLPLADPRPAAPVAPAPAAASSGGSGGTTQPTTPRPAPSTAPVQPAPTAVPVDTNPYPASAGY